jgi:hypothetical protein
MFEYKRLYKIKFKRRRANKKRYSANQVYVSKTEIKHTNLKILIILYVYNKQKLLIERYMRRIVNFLCEKKNIKNLYFLSKKEKRKNRKFISKKNRTLYILKTNFLFFKV